ncbi:hypothetical protein LWC34_02575 [Kibdelosporangium philippinense]|uniref:Uncharacterized protein n=1 Tax=Kibdelosporangium philippinense TaxID=211113 RepID=A0ABS8Z1B7_9PSEU|nr:hypothetical protein [Kibdelosporangium philippinense]MCE7001731.1 hypothetical protein [Kibdelosporangium philippinense]
MDERSKRGPWTHTVLSLIAAKPVVRAPDLLTCLSRETVSIDVATFKADVRKLKELGLTESLEVGYRLSPRGQAIVDEQRTS